MFFPNPPSLPLPKKNQIMTNMFWCAKKKKKSKKSIHWPGSNPGENEWRGKSNGSIFDI